MPETRTAHGDTPMRRSPSYIRKHNIDKVVLKAKVPLTYFDSRKLFHCRFAHPVTGNLAQFQLYRGKDHLPGLRRGVNLQVLLESQ